LTQNINKTKKVECSPVGKQLILAYEPRREQNGTFTTKLNGTEI